MATFATKLRVFTAATAVAAATTLLPMPTAQAETAAPAPAAPVVTLATPSAPTTTPGLGNKLSVNTNVAETLGDFGCGPLGFICVGAPGSAPPGQVIITIPFLGWFLGSVVICSLGYSAKQGPYGSLQISRSRRC
jgi:hypothetical protein